MRHCNSVFKPNDIWYLLDSLNQVERKIYLANCPICNKEIALYSFKDSETNCYYEKYYYSNGARKFKQRNKKDVTSTMLGFRKLYKMPSGFKFGKNIEIKRNNKIIEIRQYACDFSGNKILIKKIKND